MGVHVAGGNRRFGRYIRALRCARHLTLEDVCRLAGGEPGSLTPAVLAACERGEAALTTQQMIQLAHLYGVRPAVLVERFETDGDLGEVDRVRIARLPTPRLLMDASRAGMSGHVHRALLLYEQAELRALEGAADADEGIRARARLGIATALCGLGRYHLAREVLGELLEDEPDDAARCWAMYMLCNIGIEIGDRILARGAHQTLLEIPRPWPPQIEGALPLLKARLLAQDQAATGDELLHALLEARDAAKAHGLPTIEAEAMIRIARIERARGDLRTAETWATRTAELAETADLGWYRATALIELAQILHARNRKREARKAWHRAEALARRLGLREVRLALHAERWRLAVQDGDEKTARRELARARAELRCLGEVPLEYRDVVRALEQEDLQKASHPEDERNRSGGR